MTNDTQYDFSSLPRGEYSVNIRAQSIEDPSIVSDVTSARISLTGMRKCVYMHLSVYNIMRLCMCVCVCMYMYA